MQLESLQGKIKATHATDDVIIVCKVGFAFLAAEYLVGGQVDVVCEAHRGGWGRSRVAGGAGYGLGVELKGCGSRMWLSGTGSSSESSLTCRESAEE